MQKILLDKTKLYSIQIHSFKWIYGDVHAMICVSFG